MDHVTFEVFRFDPEVDRKPRFQSYDVELAPAMTVLEGLLNIQATCDPTLAFRLSCRAAVCGSCAMNINGSYLLACETQVAPLGRRVKIRPLAHLEVIKDLVVEMAPFWARYKEIKPYLIPGSEPPSSKEFIQSTDDRERLTTIIDCILCSACYSACPVVGTDPDYVGPAALTKANRFVRDSRDQATGERLSLAGGEHGVWRCHTVFSCQEVCPKDINPSESIAELKMAAILRSS